MPGFSPAEGEKSFRRGRLLLAVSSPVFASSIRDPRLRLPVHSLAVSSFVVFDLTFYGPCALVTLLTSGEEPNMPPIISNRWYCQDAPVVTVVPFHQRALRHDVARIHPEFNCETLPHTHVKAGRGGDI